MAKNIVVATNATPHGPNRAARRGHYDKSVTQIADEFGVSPRTIRRWIAAGRIHALRVGPRLIRLDADEVRAELLGAVGGDAA